MQKRRGHLCSHSVALGFSREWEHCLVPGLRSWRTVLKPWWAHSFSISSIASSVKGMSICKRKNHCLNSGGKYLIYLIIFSLPLWWRWVHKACSPRFAVFRELYMKNEQLRHSFLLNDGRSGLNSLILWLFFGKRKLIFSQENQTHWEPISNCMGWHCHYFDLALYTLTSASKGTIEQILRNDIELQPILFAFTAPSWIAKK